MLAYLFKQAILSFCSRLDHVVVVVHLRVGVSIFGQRVSSKVFLDSVLGGNGVMP